MNCRDLICNYLVTAYNLLIASCINFDFIFFSILIVILLNIATRLTRVTKRLKLELCRLYILLVHVLELDIATKLT